MFPILFSTEYFVIPAWHTFYMVGALAALWVMKALSRKQRLQIGDRVIAQLFVVCYVAGYFGARIFSIFIDEPDLTTWAERLLALGRFGPMTFYGGFLGALIFGTIFIMVKKAPILNLLDVSLPAGMIGLGFGRIGCFLNGDDYGIPVDDLGQLNPPWWGVTFPNLEDGIVRYPVQLYETLGAFALALLVMLLFAPLRRRFGSGSIGLWTIVGYGVLRFFLEYYRGDDRGWVMVNILSPSQLISVILTAVASVLLIISIGLRRRSLQPS